MVLRTSISNTRKFFQKTIENFKSFFSNNGTYHKLPKTPNNTSIINTHHHHRQNPNVVISSSSTSSIHDQFQPKPTDNVAKNRGLTQQPRRGDRDEILFSRPKVELVRRKLEEIEKMMNDDIINDDEHVSDVREFLHCYSRLRCAAYLDVVEQFFMEVYADFFSPQSLEHTRTAVRSRYPTAVGVRSYGGPRN